MKNKVKVLFVVSEFYQAGTQRFTYELDRALNKDLFSVEILCIIPLDASERFSDYYYSRHLDLGTKIHFINEINQLTEPTLKQKINRRLLNTPFSDERKNIKEFFNQYDCISIMGEYNFKEVFLKQEIYIGPGALFKKSVFDLIGGWRTDLIFFSDRDFWFRLSKTGSIKILSKNLAAYRTHKDSGVNNITGSDCKELLKLLDEHSYKKDIPQSLLIRINESYAEVYLLMSRFDMRAGHFFRAVNNFKKARELNPKIVGIRSFFMVVRYSVGPSIRSLLGEHRNFLGKLRKFFGKTIER